MQGLINRLRNFAEHEADLDDESKWERIEWEAADLIESQTAEIAKYKALCNQMGKSLELIYSWANNWDSEFMNDPRWKNSDVLIIQCALEAWRAMK